jgi:hypothetical protein
MIQEWDNKNYNGDSVAAVVSTERILLRSLELTNLSGSTVYLHLYDRGTIPASGTTLTVTDRTFAVGGSSTIEKTASNFGIYGLAFRSGLAWAISSTATTYTPTALSSSNFILSLGLN